MICGSRDEVKHSALQKTKPKQATFNFSQFIAMPRFKLITPEVDGDCINITAVLPSG